MSKTIKLLKSDITKINVDAIVNAANNSLLGGGGVDGAIHRSAGPGLLAECKLLNGCATGDAKITKGYRLPARFVIHTVGPVWQGGNANEEHLLKSCYIRCLEVAIQNNIHSIAFPNISTGVYGYPKKEAAAIAVNTVKNIPSTKDFPKEIIFVCFDEENYNLYEQLLNL